MRIRSIKPEFWRDPDSTGRWPVDLKLFYIGMWCVADDQGRFSWEPDLIAADLFPFDRAADVAALLQRLLESGRVQQYEANGRKYGFLPKFSKHQKIDRPTGSRFPEPPPGPGLDESSSSPRRSLVAGKEQGAGITEQGAGKRGRKTPTPTSVDDSPVVVLLPCVGAGPKEYAVTEAAVGRWRDDFPGVDVTSEVRKARAWLEANATKRKTHDGCPRFLVSWLGRAQDAGRHPTGTARKANGPQPPSSSFNRSLEDTDR